MLRSSRDAFWPDRVQAWIKFMLRLSVGSSRVDLRQDVDFQTLQVDPHALDFLLCLARPLDGR